MCHVTTKVTPNNYMPKIASVRIVQGEGKEQKRWETSECPFQIPVLFHDTTRSAPARRNPHHVGLCFLSNSFLM